MCELGEAQTVYLSQSVLCLPLMCAFIKTKSSLASTATSAISFSNKTKGNGPHFLLELEVPDLYAIKLRGGCWRDQVLVWFGCMVIQVCMLPVPLRLSCLRQECAGWSFGAGRIIYSDTLQRFWISCCPAGVEKAPVAETRTRKFQVCVCVTRAGCMPVSNRAFYLCCLGHSYRGHRNTDLSLTSDIKESFSTSLI